MKALVMIIPFWLLLSCKGEKVKNDLTDSKLHGKVKSVIRSTYEAVDNLGKIERGRLYDRHIVQFDEYGNKTEEETRHNTLNGEDKYDSKEVYAYNANHELVACNRYCKDAAKNTTINYKYNEHHQLIEEVETGYLDSKTTYRYDGAGNQIEEICLFGDMTMDIKHFYDADGNLVKSMLDGVSYTVFGYDKKGYRILQTDYKADGSLQTGGTYAGQEYHYKEAYEYSNFDKKDNWLKSIIRYNENKPYTIMEREIEYY